MRHLTISCLAILLLLTLGRPTQAQNADLQPLLESLRNVRPEGVGHRQASYAWERLVEQADANSLTTILASMDDAGPLAENWLRAAVDAVAEKQFEQTGKLPIDRLEKFLAHRSHNPRARRLAYEWISRVDENAPERLIPGMLDDPSLELRRDAVARLIVTAESQAKDSQSEIAKSTYRKALASARDLDQVKLITEALSELGAPVDLQHHYGFIVDWQLIGPFDNRGGQGFNEIYPPEKKVDLSASYEGSAGTVSWKPHHTDQEYGEVDLNKALGKHMGVAGYAATVFKSDRDQPAEIRIGSENAIKAWLNGEELCEAEAYHANSAIDQYVGRGILKKGDNLILVKVCQDEQTVDWAQNWVFQLRVCDATGQAILSTGRPPANPKPAKAQSTASADTE